MHPINSSSNKRLPLLSFLLCSFLSIAQFNPALVPSAHCQETAPQQSLFTIENTSDSAFTLVPSIHLVPPGSTLIIKNKTLAELREQKDGKELEQLAMADINFFEGQLRKKLGAEAQF
ncbi:MAG: hypothetical protein KKD63_05130, partial [Proteobacteria bacterium]|nr:hypothetical protein [Pseudomonadota bacterium]